ncbi:MAG: hydrogenase nickel incorporation protein HypB [Clostridiales bacterium]
MRIDIEQDMMAINNAYAADNRQLFHNSGTFAINIMGSPGAGKTTLLERTLHLLQNQLKVAVIEGDLATAKDAKRIASCGVAVVQINTDGGCHLDAKMISRVLPGFYVDSLDMLIIENVGNLVCPASFDLGEDLRIVVMSVTEGGDKPTKYPMSFMSADVVVLNKMDILEASGMDIEETKNDLITINPQVKIFETCCRQGEVQGVDRLAEYLIAVSQAKKKRQ